MSQSAEDLLRRAAAAAYEHIDRDLARANEESSRMLEFIRRHLFNPSLDVSWMLAGLQLSHNVSSRFRALMGVGPRRYIEQRRLETARRLLSDTRLEVREIGKLVGYRRFAAFSHAFKQRTGWRPKTYRSAHPPKSRPPATEPGATAEIQLDSVTRRAAHQLAREYGCSDSEAIRRAVRHLHDAVFGLPGGRGRETGEPPIEDRGNPPLL